MRRMETLSRWGWFPLQGVIMRQRSAGVKTQGQWWWWMACTGSSLCTPAPVSVRCPTS